MVFELIFVLQDLVDATFELSKAYPHQSVIINSATGSVSRLVPVGQNSPDMRKVNKGPRCDKILHLIL